MNMNRVATRLVLAVLLVAASVHATEKDSLQLTLPSAWYAVPGVTMSLYYDNIVLTETPEK